MFVAMIPALHQKIFAGFSFEKGGKTYEKLGVPQFKKFLPMGHYWIQCINLFVSNPLQIITSPKKAAVWIIFTLAVELLHFSAFVILTFFALKYLGDGKLIVVLKITLMNLLLNIYPILTQRYNRFRLLKIFDISRGDLANFEIEL